MEVDVLSVTNCGPGNFARPNFFNYLKGNFMNNFFVLSHVQPEKPVFIEELLDEHEVICGGGVDYEVFNGLLFDDEFLERVREFCSHHHCNQVVVSLKGHPGLYRFTTDERLEPI